ncbi:N-formylglutamate amidohydrolase [Acidimangrovimonas sediminis]|uniref:N-formylglutamate amidohydrolase n=1 Tax=Acidimangrovimonas sediminis TaxID=2056283 RepID=UPI000C800A6C|nr:N-formylglutamate amidohydrolase [Acidimangrovimonas sediminis]
MIPAPILLNPEGRFPGLIVVDHAGTEAPAALGSLGLAPEWCDTHHYCDLGVTALAHRIAARLDVPMVLCPVSRLVIDVNRWIDDPRSILMQVEGQQIAGNAALAPEHRLARQEQVFWPYQEAVGRMLARVTARHAAPIFFALHSCTRVFDGARRPWDGGTIWHDDARMSRALLSHLGRESSLTLGDNAPYSGRDGAYTLDRHTFGSGLPACGFEVSNDLLETAEGQEAWADRLSGALQALACDGVQA